MADPDAPKIDFQALAREAQETTYNPRAKRCFWLFHAWSMWETSEDTRVQGRRCTRCGRIQRKPLETTHAHRWITTSTRDIVPDGKTIPCGVRYFQKCAGCGEIRSKDL